MRSVQANDRILIQYRVLDAAGTVLEDSRQTPVEITLGEGSLPYIVESTLLGRKVKEHICIEITASDEAFGAFDQTKIQRLPSSQFEGFGAVEPGMLLEFSLPDGEGVAGCVTEVAESEITVDFNHPLIGRDCIYEMDLVGFVNSTREQTAKDPAT